MSDDLISRRALLEAIDSSFVTPILKINMREEHKAVSKIWEIIVNMPTAFDKEKVIKELREELNLSDAEKERCARENPLQFDSAKGYANGIANSIEIVEKGGIE